MLAAALFGSAQATTVKPVELGQLTEISEAVVLGRVQKKEVRAEQGQVWTDLTIEVEEAWKGKTPQVIHFSQLGGETPELQQKILGYPSFVEGERLVLFLERTSSGRLVVTGLSMGKYRVFEDAQGKLWAARDTHELGFYKRQDFPVTYLTGIPQNSEKMPVEALKKIVQNRFEPVPFEKIPARLVRLPAKENK